MTVRTGMEVGRTYLLAAVPGRCDDSEEHVWRWAVPTYQRLCRVGVMWGTGMEVGSTYLLAAVPGRSDDSGGQVWRWAVPTY